MENFTKITTGEVKQYYEPDENGAFVCISQEFVAGDIVECEDDYGEPVDIRGHQYQPYDMQQPDQLQQQTALLDAAKEIVSDFNRYREVLQVGDNGEYGTESAIGRLDAAINQIKE